MKFAETESWSPNHRQGHTDNNPEFSTQSFPSNEVFTQAKVI